MTDSEQHPYIELIAREARRPVVTDRAARERIMAAVRAEPLPSRLPFWARVFEPRSIRLAPATGALLAAGLVGIGVITSQLAINRDGRPSVGQVPPVAAKLPVSDTVFVFVAPRASKVSLVGDFNGWDAKATPMRKVVPQGTYWSVTLPLSAGRHVYAFVVDSQWVADQHAPLAPDDGFGRPNSVRLVGRGSSL